MISLTYLATVLLLLSSPCLGGRLNLRQDPTAPACGFIGNDINIWYDGNGTYATFTACNAQCTANAACLSFAISPTECILYAHPVEGYDTPNPTSQALFYNRGGICPTTTTTSSTTSPTTTAPADTSVPTCGFTGWDSTGSNIGFYTDANLLTYSGCSTFCSTVAACLSFAISATAPACILYDHLVEGYNVADPASPYVFFDRGGVCPPTTVTTTSSSSASAPTQTGAFAGCPAGIVPFNINTLATPYSPCDPNYSFSVCQEDVDGSAYCNLCLSCTTTLCASDADCPAGYACLVNTQCVVDGAETGAAVCAPMLRSGLDCVSSPA